MTRGAGEGGGAEGEPETPEGAELGPNGSERGPVYYLANYLYMNV